MTLAIYEDESGTDNDTAVEHPASPDDESLEDLTIDEDKQLQSDILLSAAYKKMNEASEAMAHWSRATAEALDAKIDAARREFQASTELLRAQARFQAATADVGDAVAHRVGPHPLEK